MLGITAQCTKVTSAGATIGGTNPGSGRVRFYLGAVSMDAAKVEVFAGGSGPQIGGCQSAAGASAEHRPLCPVTTDHGNTAGKITVTVTGAGYALIFWAS